MIGVIGAGSFGTAIANLIAEKNNVMLYVRDKEKSIQIDKSRINSNQKLAKSITIINSLRDVVANCNTIFPIVPSANFRKLMQQLAPYLKPYHILIHGTKGLDVSDRGDKFSTNKLFRNHVYTMSEVILEETNVVRVGCLAGPNLAKEIDKKYPAATVIASKFDEVINTGQKLLKNDRFLVYGNNDLIGIELCGVLKNIIAIGAGAISGKKLGENAKALLISRGIVEMIHIGRKLGGNTKAFIGLAGIGDLMATCASKLSRNFTVGYRLAKGETMQEIADSMDELAEGVNTINIIKELANTLNIRVPITETLYKILHGKMTVDESHHYFMKFPFSAEIDFI